MADWSTACPDWEERIIAGRPLVPDLPLFADEAARAVRIFNRLKLPDVIGTPTMGEAAGEWLVSIVEALFGSYDAAANRRMVQEFFLLVPKKNGKALALDTPVATPAGFKAMRDIQVGDLVIDDMGKPAPVEAKSPVYIGHECFEVEFSTGERIVCDAGHLWVTDAHRDREKLRTRGGAGPAPSVKTTREIAASVKVPSGQYVINNHRTALCAALDLPPANLPIPPYALGAWLGDGAKDGAVISAGADDAAAMVERLTACGQPAYIRPGSLAKAPIIALTTWGARGQRIAYRFRAAARALGVLGDKHIPVSYLRASVDQRLALLRGLMDTDGTISKAGQASFTTTIPRLRDDIVELVNSLGFKASVSEGIARLNGKNCGAVWDIQFWPFDSVPVFSMPRKAARQTPRRGRNSPRSATRQIVAVRSVPSVPVQCISVGSPTKQFLVTRSLIPTHNSTMSAAFMVVAMIVNRRPNAEFLLIAPTKQIADIAFKQAWGIIRLDEALKATFHPQDHIRKITHRRTGAVLQIKAADTDVITGSKSTGILVDETHVFAKKPKAADIFVEIRGALAARPDGFMIQITTQSKEPPSGVFAAELAIARDVRDGKLALPLLPVLYEFPESISRDSGWKDERTWGMVNPNLGRSVDPTFLRNELTKAERKGPSDLALFASQHLNIQIGQSLRADGWAGAQYWQRGVESGLTLDELLRRSEVVTIGVDGGGLDDLLGVGVIGREIGTKRWLGWARAFVSPEGMERRKANASVYQDFIADGDLVLVLKLPDDIAAVVALVTQVADTGLLAQVGVDAIGIGGLADALAEADVTVANETLGAVRQGIALMGAIKTIERKLADGTFRHGGSRMMAWCVGNALVVQTPTAMRIAREESGYGKIDPLMALFDAAALMAQNPEAAGSVYDDLPSDLPDEGDGGEIDFTILQDMRHPRFAEMKEKFERRQAMEVDDY